MKLFIASDIHGSEYYCRKMLDSFDRENADRMLLLGDILYHGPRNDLPQGYSPKSVIQLLKPYTDIITAVRGNCDADVDLMVLGWDMPYTVTFDFDGTMFSAYHGHTEAPECSRGEVLASGHTHIPLLENREGVCFVNPGSVSIPKQGSANGYCVFENRVFSHKDLCGNLLDTLKLTAQ